MCGVRVTFIKNKIMSCYIKKFVILFVLSFLANNVYARFQNIDDAAVVYDFFNTNIIVKKDGTYESVCDFEVTIMKERGREIFSKYIINYNSGTEFADILEAKTISNGIEYIVTKDNIEDKLIGNSSPGFDDNKQLAVNFPNLEIGTKIYLKYKFHNKKPLIDNEFAQIFTSHALYLKKLKIIVNSEIDLQIKINDPYDVLSTNMQPIEGKPNYFRKIEIDSVKPITEAVIDDVPNGDINTKLLTYVSISSLNSWKDLGNKTAVDYMNVQNQKLPKLFIDILKEASKEKDFESQVNKIVTKLNEKIQYFGNWGSHKGRFAPQDFSVVASKQSGDCKDFSSITVKILKELGYKANVALVIRGEGQTIFDDILPTSVFNHAMVKAQNKNGKIYWLDPTNMLSMADGIFPDIAGKYTLVLDKEESSYEKIPDISEDHSKIIITKLINRNKIVNVKCEFLGEESIMLTGAELYLSKKAIESFLYSYLKDGNIPEENRKSSDIPDLNSRIVKPITISLSYKDDNMFFKTNFGDAYKVYNDNSIIKNIAMVNITSDVLDLYINHPRTIENKIIFEKRKVQNLENLNFNIKTPFITLLRQCYVDGENSVIDEKLIIHRSWIKSSEFSSENFKKLQMIINKNLINSAVILEDS